MREYTKEEKAIIEYLIEKVSFEVFCIEQDERDKGRLDYSLCSDYDEKQEITQKKIDKFKKKVDKCDPAIAVFLIEFTSPFHKSTDIYELRDILTRNFLTGHYAELIESLSNENIEELEKYNFEYNIKSRGFNYKLLKKFIEGICDVNHYLLYKSFLDIPRNENISYDHIIEKLNNAFFRLESFMKFSVKEYYHFDFNTAFTELFYFTSKVDNFTYDNCKRIGQYWDLTERIRIDYDKSDFENLKAFENKAFCNDCDVLTSINWHRAEEFINFQTPDEIEEQNKKVSITDLMKPGTTINLNVKKNKKQETANNHSPYILSAVHPIEKKIKSLVITKNEFIQKIKDAEILAEDTFKVTIDQDLLAIQQKKINDGHYVDLIFGYYQKTLRSYQSVVNLYKESLDQFDLLNNNSKNTLTEEDRIDFIATVLFGYLTNISNKINKYKFDESKKIFSQLKNIDTLIYETRLIKLKASSIRETMYETAEKVAKEKHKIAAVEAEKKEKEKEKEKVKIIENYVASNKFQMHNNLNSISQIFTNSFGHNFFEDLHLEFKDSNSVLADYSFIYRMMVEDKLIIDYIKPEMFKSWLKQDPFNINLENKLKTLDRCKTSIKVKIYYNIKSNVKNNLK